MKKIFGYGVLVGVASLLLFGLVWAQGKAEKPEGKASMIPASGAALWDHMKKADYAKKWKMWPGTHALYPGKSPHGAFLTTYVNGPALKAIEAKKGALPEGAIIAKQNFDKDKKYVALTVMYKVKGYDPEEGDWFWAKYSPAGKVEAEGKISGCINCHTKARDNDFVFTSPLK
jgi:hypothetical protein